MSCNWCPRQQAAAVSWGAQLAGAALAFMGLRSGSGATVVAGVGLAAYGHTQRPQPAGPPPVDMRVALAMAQDEPLHRND